jgi:hypothetical protein
VVRVEVEAGQVRYIRSLAKMQIVQSWYEPEATGTKREIGVLGNPNFTLKIIFEYSSSYWKLR